MKPLSLQSATAFQISRPVRRLGVALICGIAACVVAWLFLAGRPVPAPVALPPTIPTVPGNPVAQQPANDLATLEYQAAMSPRNPELALALGQAYAERSRSAEALGAFQRASQIDPELIPARVGQGQMWEKLQRPAAAVEAFQWALKRLPDNPELHLEVASAFLNLRDINSAVAHLRKAVKLAPDNPEAHRALASGYLITLTHDGALREATRATELVPGDVENWTVLGEVYLNSNRPKEAGETLRHALSLKPEATTPNVLLARSIIEGAKDPASMREAYGLLLRALATDPFHPEATYLLGKYYSEVEDFPRAAGALRRAWEADPESTKVMLLLGQTLVKLGQPAATAEGRQLIARALKIVESTVDFRGLEFQAARNPNPNVHLRLSELYLQQGLYDSARYLASRALARNPKDPETRHRLEAVVQQANQKVAKP